MPRKQEDARQTAIPRDPTRPRGSTYGSEWLDSRPRPLPRTCMKASTFRLGINLWPPFLFTGIHVTRITPDYRQIDVELRLRPWNRNYVGTHFGGSLFAMTDPFWMIMTLRALGKDHVVWDKAGEIEFIRPGRGTVHAAFDLDTATVEAIRAVTADGSKHLHWFTTDVVDASGELVARVRKQVYVRRKRRSGQSEVVVDSTR